MIYKKDFFFEKLQPFAKTKLRIWLLKEYFLAIFALQKLSSIQFEICIQMSTEYFFSVREVQSGINNTHHFTMKNK